MKTKSSQNFVKANLKRYFLTCLFKAHTDPISRICAGLLLHNVGAAAEPILRLKLVTYAL